jgi:hypothetical protein
VNIIPPFVKQLIFFANNCDCAGFHIKVGDVVLLKSGNEAVVGFIVKVGSRKNLMLYCMSLESESVVASNAADIDRVLRPATAGEANACRKVVAEYYEKKHADSVSCHDRFSVVFTFFDDLHQHDQQGKGAQAENSSTRQVRG